MNSSRSHLPYHTDKQSKTGKKALNKTSIINEELLPERQYYGINTFMFVGALRHFKMGGYNSNNIHTISDLAEHLYKSGDISKHGKDEGMPLEFSSLVTELNRIWAVIKKEDTTLIDPYGYSVKIIHK